MILEMPYKTADQLDRHAAAQKMEKKKGVY